MMLYKVDYVLRQYGHVHIDAENKEQAIHEAKRAYEDAVEQVKVDSKQTEHEVIDVTEVLNYNY